MRHLLIAAAALAACGVLATTSARAESTFDPGGPVRMGGMCQVFTHPDQLYGYQTPCAPQPVTYKRRKARG